MWVPGPDAPRTTALLSFTGANPPRRSKRCSRPRNAAAPRRHEVIALTRSPQKLQLLRDLGAEAVLCDVYDSEALLDIAQRARPETLVNFVTDLAARAAAANHRARREGGANLLKAATASGASRLVVESVAFAVNGDAAQAVEELEQATRGFARAALILRFGRLWGPGTSYETPPQPPTIHIEKAGAEAARLLTHAPPATYIVTASQ